MLRQSVHDKNLLPHDSLMMRRCVLKYVALENILRVILVVYAKSWEMLDMD